MPRLDWSSDASQSFERAQISDMSPRLDQPLPVDYGFSAPIGVDVKGDLWSAVTIPDSAAVLGSLKSVRVDTTVDEVHVVILRRLT